MSGADPMPVVALGGWGMPASLIEPLLPVAADRQIHVPGLPEPDSHEAPEQWLAKLMPQVPAGALWVGWSLGGGLAMLAARQWPEQVGAVVTIASTPCFVTRSDWPEAMPQAEFDQFTQALACDEQRVRKRFMALMVSGDAQPRAAMHTLKACSRGPVPSPEALRITLGWLRSIDERSFWSSARLPALHLFGEQDALVRSGTPQALGLDDGRYRVLEGVSHWPRGQQAERIGSMIKRFWEQSL